jgi:two-component system phosphate regulon sensor histidine kinase PhoR
MKVWYFFSAVLLFVVIFFAYTQIVILRQKRFSEFQKDFIDNITHELKTPISSIFLSSEVLLNDEFNNEPDRIRKYAKIINSQTSFLKNQIDRILHLSGKNLSSSKLVKEDFFLEKQLEEIIRNLSPELQSKKGTFNVQMNCKDVLINADRLHFINTVTNIIDNAIKYCDKKPVISIRLDCDDKLTTLEIRDNGPGISKVHQRKIFRKFYRIPTGNIHNTKGFGLGLSYVRKVARLHKWKLDLESEPGQGTRFRIVIEM